MTKQVSLQGIIQTMVIEINRPRFHRHEHIIQKRIGRGTKNPHRPSDTSPKYDDLNYRCVSQIFLVVFGGGTSHKSRQSIVGGGKCKLSKRKFGATHSDIHLCVGEVLILRLILKEHRLQSLRRFDCHQGCGKGWIALTVLKLRPCCINQRNVPGDLPGMCRVNG